MNEVTTDRLGRATAMVTLALNDDPNVISPLIPLARLGPAGMTSELIATLRAMSWLSARLAAAANESTGEAPQVVLQRVSAVLQAEILGDAP
jgi:hypothetical protein